jgi:GMP synthase (glutamine-hydrolysing)
MKALVVCHKSPIDAGIFSDMLKARGFEIELRMGYNDEIGEIDAKAHDLAVFMGGPMGVYQADIFPYIANEVAYIEKRLAAEKPYLGICLGAQMMAKAMGADVYPGHPGKEIGWHHVAVNDEGMKTPVQHLDVSQTKMMQWHGDTFDKPAEAKLLASSDMYENQAIAYGKKALGLQFHPEVTKGNIELWLATGFHQLQQAGLDVPTLRAQTQENVEKLNAQTKKFFSQWLDETVE